MNPGVEFFRGFFIHADGRVRICLYAFCHRIFHVDFGEKVCPFLSYCVFRESQPDCLDHALAEMADAPECDGVRFASLVKFRDLGADSSCDDDSRLRGMCPEHLVSSFSTSSGCSRFYFFTHNV